jgi:hypothetical protein
MMVMEESVRKRGRHPCNAVRVPLVRMTRWLMLTRFPNFAPVSPAVLDSLASHSKNTTWRLLHSHLPIGLTTVRVKGSERPQEAGSEGDGDAAEWPSRVKATVAIPGIRVLGMAPVPPPDHVGVLDATKTTSINNPHQ